MQKTAYNVIYLGLQVTVVIAALGLVLSTWLHSPHLPHYAAQLSEESVERNERSTPRSFILPATPGVAFEQERRRTDTTQRDEIARCIAMLRRRGYRVGQDDLLNAKLVEAVYTFQKQHGLSPSGQFDRLTMQELECR